MKKKPTALCGNNMPAEPAFRARQRFHQCWWRACVLNEEMGTRPGKSGEPIGSMISDGKENAQNFISANITRAVEETLEERKIGYGRGAIEENRLYNNLLSSQPLCFNFFGELKTDPGLALQVLRQFWPEVTEVNMVIFEYAPRERYTGDNSAFDVAFEVMEAGQQGIIGLECKYTDTFSPPSTAATTGQAGATPTGTSSVLRKGGGLPQAMKRSWTRASTSCSAASSWPKPWYRTADTNSHARASSALPMAQKLSQPAGSSGRCLPGTERGSAS